MSNKTLLALTAKLTADTTKFKSGLDKGKRELNGFSKSIGKIGGMMAGAFAVGSLIAYGNESRELAGQAEGVYQAFQKLNQPHLLEDLQKSTRDTVSDLDLMKAAVQAKNFKIPLDQLATYFEFATKRSAETGQSVDYLVESIINGIGRKSPLILDNLGISAAELSARFKETGDFGQAAGDIIRTELGNMGDVMLTSSQKQAKLNSEVTNFKVELGNLINTITGELSPAMSGFMIGLTGATSLLNKTIKDKDISFWEKLAGMIGGAGNQAALFADIFGNEVLKAEKDAYEVSEEYGKSLQNQLEIQQKLLRTPQSERLFNMSDESIVNNLNDLNIKIAEYEKRIESLPPKEEKNITTLKDLQEQLTEVNTEIQNANINDQKSIAILNDKAKALEEQIKWLKELNTTSLVRNETPGQLTPIATGEIPTMDFDEAQFLAILNLWDQQIESIDDYIKKIEAAEDSTKRWEGVTQQAITQLADTIGYVGAEMGRTLSDSESSWKSFAGAALSALLDVAYGLLAVTIMNLYEDSTNEFGLWGLLIGTAAAAGMYGIFDSLIATNFADGGIVSGETIARVGEYPGAANNPEVIAPLSKLKSIIGNTGFGGQVTFKIEGRDLIGIIKKQNTLNNAY